MNFNCWLLNGSGLRIAFSLSVVSNKLWERIKSFSENIEQSISSSVIEIFFKSFRDKQRRYGINCEYKWL